MQSGHRQSSEAVLLSPLEDLAAVDMRIPCFTSLDTARAAVESLANGSAGYNVKPLRSYLEGG